MKTIAHLLLFTIFLISACNYALAQPSDQNEYAGRREEMVQALESEYPLFEEWVFSALRTTPREAFIPTTYKKLAYEKNSIPLGNGVTLATMDFYTRALEATQAENTGSVLVMGYGAGYAAALLSSVVETVYLIEYDPSSLWNYEQIFSQLNIQNINVNSRTIAGSWREMSPFDTIFIHGAVTHIPENVSRHLKPEGTLVFSLTDTAGFQVLVSVVRSENGFSLRMLGESFVTKIEEFDFNAY
jgi:protein-L-isoaspartate(D-aspartate) O-methyltransferase